MSRRKLIFFSAILCILNLFNLFGVCSGYTEAYGDTSNLMISKQVKIIDTITIEHDPGYQRYIYGLDKDNNKIKIPSDKYDVGDTITVYQNPKSMNAQGSDPEWFIHPDQVQNNAKFGFYMFIVFLITTISLSVVCFVKLNHKERKYEDNQFQSRYPN